MKLKLIVVFGILINTLLFADNIEHFLDFETPKIIETDDYHRIIFDDMQSIVAPGQPEIPSKAIQILLPFGHTATSISIETSQPILLSEEYNIIPQQKPIPLSYKGKVDFIQPDKDIYNSNKFFPEKLNTNINTQFLRGHSIANFHIYPLQYNPVTKKIQYFEKLTIKIETRKTRFDLENFLRNDPITHQKINNLVQNPELLSRYPIQNRERDEIYDYVIITGNSYVNEFNDFIAFKTSQGYSVLIKTVEDIYAEYPGEDNAEKVRNFIKYTYQENGTDYVLLGGDTNIVPYRGFYVDSYGTTDYNIPADIYFSGLDRVGNGNGPDWNTNDNSYWGEHSEADYYSEIYLGRISGDDATEIQNALNKQIMYQESPVVSDLENALMVGEELNDDPQTWGGDYKDEIADGGNYNGYYTEAISPNINVETLYDRDFYWGSNHLFSALNSGVNFLNHLGHSNTDYNMKLYMGSVTDQNITANGINHNFFVAYSQGCYPAAFDDNCIIEKFTTIQNGCAVFVANSRYGWYMPGGTNSSSQYYDRQFFDASFGENLFQVGMMHNDAKDDAAPYCTDDNYRWVHYQLNLFGDPSLDMWTAEPDEITAIYPPSISVGADQVSFQTDAPFAQIALIQNDELIGKAIADENGDATITTYEPITTAEPIQVSIIAHNKLPYSGDLVVVSDEPYVIFNAVEIDDSAGNGNGLVDYAETIALDITLKNVGNQPANGIEAVLICNDDNITLLDSLENYGNIGAQAISNMPAGFSFEVADDIIDQYEVLFTMEITDTGGEIWNSYFTLTLNAPEFALGEIFVDDSAGNANGILDPGEDVFMILQIENIGHSLSPDTYIGLSTDNDLITIEPSLLNVGLIPAQNQNNGAFNVIADGSIELGTIIDFDVILTSGSYMYQTSFDHSIGLIKEDFETGDFSNFPWEFTGDADWIISDGAYEGLYCARSGNIGNLSTTGLKIEVDVIDDSEIKFWRTVSSEANYDYLKFYIDNNMMGQWSGDEGWAEESYNVAAGSHVFEWRYEKDTYVSGGTDCARVDFVVFPSLGAIFPPILHVDPNIVNVEVPANQTEVFELEFSNIGGDVLDYEISTTNIPTWLSYEPDAGNIATGSSETIELTFDPANLEPGNYSSALIVDYYLEEQTIIPIMMTVTATDANNILPAVTEFNGNFPNPFNPTTNFKFSLKKRAKVNLQIYNIKGQKVRTLISEKMEAGYHSMIWDGKDENRRNAASGVYFSIFEADDGDSDYTSTKKIILLK